MRLRSSALLLALLVAGAPAALTACEMVCASGDVRSDEGTHSCHDTRPQGTTSVRGGTHVCGHTDGLPAASRELTSQGAAAPAVLALVPTPVEHAAITPSRPLPVSPSPPGRLTLTRHLRI